MLKLSAYQLKLLSITRLLKSFAQQAMALERIMVRGSGAVFLAHFNNLAISQSELSASPYDQHKSDVTANHKSGHDVKQLLTSFYTLHVMSKVGAIRSGFERLSF